MSDFVVHLLLFVLVATAIVTLGSFYADAGDERALRALPRRFLVFCFGCALLAGIMLICEHTFASVT